MVPEEKSLSIGIRTLRSLKDELKVTLALPPSVNHSHREWYSKGRMMRVPTKKTKEWTLDAKCLVMEAAKNSEWQCISKQKVVVEIEVYWPDKRKRDMHNLHKLLADALEGLVYDDDRWALLRDIDFNYDKKNPRMELKIYRKEEDNGSSASA
jgi:crossover junction endodeoxyribonuclease RusA